LCTGLCRPALFDEQNSPALTLAVSVQNVNVFLPLPYNYDIFVSISALNLQTYFQNPASSRQFYFLHAHIADFSFRMAASVVK
jgi:hypothetical protein